MKCKFCTKYDYLAEDCSLCQFEYDEELPWTKDDHWDILNLNDDIEWSHLQIQYRLKSKNIDCLHADIWFDNDVAFIIGAKANEERIAEALGLHKQAVYMEHESGLCILNLFKEKYLRGLLDK